MVDNLLQFPGTVTVRHPFPGEMIELVFNDGGRVIVKPVSEELSLLIIQGLISAIYSNAIYRARILAEGGVLTEIIKEDLP